MEEKKVLIVEDDSLLQTAFKMFVKDLGYNVVGLASNGNQSLELCKSNNPDVVLMDIHLPGGIDGIKASEEIQQKYDIPVVYITSDINDETIKRAIDSNSYGYLLKPVSKSSLKISIELALEKFKFDKQLKASKERYKTLVEDSPDSVFVVDSDLHIQYLNSSGLKLIQNNKVEEVINTKISDFIRNEDIEIFSGKISSAIENNQKLQYQSLNFRSGDKFLSVGFYGSVIDFNGKKAIQLIVSDHSEKLSAKQIIDKQINIIENIDNSILIISEDGIINYWNKGSKNLFGFEKEDIVGRDFDYLCQSDSGFLKNVIFETLLKESKHSFSLKLIHNYTGRPLEVKFTLNALKDENNSISNIVCYCHNVTKEEKIKENSFYNETTFKSVFNSSLESIILINKDRKIIDFNKTAEIFFKNIVNRPLKYNEDLFNIIYFFNQEELHELINNVFEGVTHYLERTIRFVKENNYLKINIHPIYNTEDIVDHFYISILDVTERKQIEQELEDIKSELKPMFDSSIQRFYLIGLNYKLLAFNKSAYDIIQREFNRSLKKGDNIVDYVSREMSSEEFIEHFENAKKGNHVTFKEKHTTRDDVSFSEVHLEPIISEKGDITKILLWTLDTTENEKTILALKESEERYLLVAKGGNDGLWDWNLKTNELFLSPRWKSFLGYNENEYISREDVKDQFVHPDDREKTKQALKKHLLGETDVYTNEYRLRHKDGTYLWILERGLAIRDEEGKPYRVAGSITDITEQIKRANELKALNNVLMQERSMFLKGNVVVFRLNSEDFTIKYFSSNIYEVLGYSEEELKAKNSSFLSLIHDDDKDVYVKERDVVLMAQELHTEFSIYRLKHKNGEIVYVKDFISLTKDENEKNVDLLGYFIDVTSERIAQNKILENQKKYFNLFSKANDAIIIIDDYKIIDCNEKAEQIFGYTKKELIANDLAVLSPEIQPNGESSDERRKRKITNALEGDFSTFYWQYKRSNGELFDSEVSLNSIEIDSKKYLHVIIRDISKRKKIEKDLNESKQHYKNLFEAMPDMIFILDKAGNYIDFKPELRNELDSKYEDIVGKSLKDYFDIEKESEFLNKIKAVLNGSKTESIYYSLETSIGLRNFEARLTLYNIDQIFVLVRDFTDLKF